MSKGLGNAVSTNAPNQQLSVISLSNADNMYSLTHKSLKIAELIQPEAFKEVGESNPIFSKGVDQLNATHKVGFYLNKINLSNLRVLTLEEDSLHASRSINGYQQPLTPVSMNTFVNTGLGETAYEFVTDEDGKPEKLYFREHANGYTLERILPAKLEKQRLQATIKGLHRYLLQS